MIRRNTTCRDCGSDKLTLFLDLNDQPPANAFVANDSVKDEANYPLKAYVCENCQLVQLIDVVDLDELFQDYVYFSAGAGTTTPKHFSDYAEDIIKRFSLKKDAFVVELGSNDGLLLQAFKEQGISNVLGVDPARNVAEVANKRGVETLAQPWNEALAKEIQETRGSADLVIGNNVVAHINDHQDLFKGIRALLSPKGVFVFEAPYLIDMFDNLSFDTIYHEHLSCLSLRPIKRMVEELGLEVIDMETKAVQGVSMRVFIAQKGAHVVSERVEEFVQKELAYKLDSVDTYHTLAKRVHARKKEILTLLEKLKAEGKRIAGYGAPAKGNTLLNFLETGPETLEYLTDESTKIGKLSPGMHIPVIDVKEARETPPDYFVLLAWNYLDSVLEKEKDMRAKGTKFIVPIGEKVIII